MNAVPRTTGLVIDERCLGHRNPPGDRAFGTFPEWAPLEPFERPERLSLTARVLDGSGVREHVAPIPARMAEPEELALAHQPAFVRRVLDEAARGVPVRLGHEAWVGPGSRDAALVAVGGVLEATQAVLGGACENAFALVRPPGHHAGPAAAMGFCLFNAAAVAARWAQREHGVERVAIIDWDVHHGNGTEAIFLEDPSVLTISLHQDGLYPADTGGLSAHGEGAGTGSNANVPLPAFTGDEGYALAWDRVVVALVERFAPDLVVLAAGQDAAASDPLGRMSLTLPGFRALTDRAVALADAVCGGRLVAVLEGGYSLQHTPLANLAILEGLAGLPPTFAHDWVGCDVPASVSEATRAAVAAAESVHLAA